jgi:ketosteroid isomerase-like protein
LREDQAPPQGRVRTAGILGVEMGRHLDERLALRAHRLTRQLAKLVLALPPGSPVRRRALKRLIARGWEALSRRDDEVVLLIFDRDIEFKIIGGAAGGAPPGLGARYHGHAGWLEFIGLWRAEWGGGHIEHTPEAVIDLGDRLVMRVTLRARGASSGADVAMTMGIVSWLADGAIVRQDNYYQWSECLEALGLHEVAPAISA